MTKYEEIHQAAVKEVTAAEEAVLSKIFAAPVPVEPKAEAPVEEVKETPEAAVVAEEGVESKKESSEESDPEWEKACTALALDGVPKSLLERLDRTEALEWASKAKERQTKTAQELKSRAERIKELESGVTTPKTETKGTQPQGPTDFGDDPELKAIRDALGDEIAAPLAKLIERRTAKATEAEKRYEDRIAQLEAEHVRNLVDGARASLKEQFPQLDDPAKLEEVHAEMAAHLPKYQDLAPAERAKMAMRDAARVVLFDDVKASEAGKALASYRKRIGSQPTPPNGKTPTPKAMTAAEREDALLDAIFKGDAEAKERLMRG